MSLRNLKSISLRKKYLEDKLNIKLTSVSVYPEALEKAQYKNCENMIGAIQIPLGVAGPLKVLGQFAEGQYYLPLSTTEGALVASLNRGCKALTLSGGVRSFCLNVGISRGSVFKTAGLKDSFALENFLQVNFPRLKKLAAATSSYLRLIKMETKIIGNLIYVRFSFDTKEAMGMNMATFATDKLADFIEKQTGNSCLSLAANFDVDKKPAFLNFLSGRGRQVWAEATVSAAVIKEVLKTTAHKIDEVVKAKCYLGSIISGSLGFNAHFANVLAALFIALGQDVAHVAEGSIGLTTTEIVNSNLYISVYLPDLPLGTVGGGTYLPAQHEALSILNLGKTGKGEQANKLAEIVAGAVLAGELSLLAALSAGQLAKAHLKLAR